MEIEYQNTRKDYIDSFKLAIKDRFRNNYFFNFYIFLIAILYAMFENYGVIGYLVILLCCVAFIILISYIIPLVKTVIKFNKLIAKGDSQHTLKKKLTISDEGIRTQNEKNDLLRNWESVTRISSNEKFIHISLADKSIILLPKRHFSSQVDVANFIGLVESYIIKTKGSLKAQTPVNYAPAAKAFSQKSNPPYLLGFLCIIPIIGAFIGLGLLLYGIFVYKEKWISIIGAGGILVTVIMFYCISHPTGNNSQAKQGFAEIDKTELNSVVKELEFYKLQNGSYPDSLQQLDTKGSSTSIDDPLLIYINNGGNHPYNYHKIGKKYTLFSSGIDQKPNTADDIYPTIDTSKTGLIIPMVKH